MSKSFFIVYLFKHISHKKIFMTYVSREIVWKTFSFYIIEINIKILVLAYMFSEKEKKYPIIIGKYSYLCICNHYVMMIITWTKGCFVACYWFWILFIYLFMSSIYNEHHYIVKNSYFRMIKKINRWFFSSIFSYKTHY